MRGLIVCKPSVPSEGMRELWGKKYPAVQGQWGVSQEAFAVDAGIDRTYVCRLERGLENPAVLERIALALEVEITELFAVPKKNDGLWLDRGCVYRLLASSFLVFRDQ
jgi:hypothetical protein